MGVSQTQLLQKNTTKAGTSRRGNSHNSCQRTCERASDRCVTRKPLVDRINRLCHKATGNSVLASTRDPWLRNCWSKMKETIMKIVVIGGSGLIGSKLVIKLREHGHEAIAASPSSGVNTLTGERLAEALKGASVVVDVCNSPSFEDAAVLKFFETSTR